MGRLHAPTTIGKAHLEMRDRRADVGHVEGRIGDLL
jgi:hypothetical protein